jgi:hypothetical protein
MVLLGGDAHDTEVPSRHLCGRTCQRGIRKTPKVSGQIRLYVSSTFADVAFEREALQQSVFPHMRVLC